MVREISIKDDLDGSPDAEEVIFAFDGVTWAIDLAEANRTKLQEALQPYLDAAHPAQVAHVSEPEPARRTRRPRGEATDTSEKINFATLEHAGTPHQGRVSPAEAQLVRDHLDEINKRLEQEGRPVIDPTDEKTKQRYKFGDSDSNP